FAAAARARVLPVPAGPVITSAVRGEVSACQIAAAWSSRSPPCAPRSRAFCARSRSCASSTAGSASSRCAAISGVRRGAACARAWLRGSRWPASPGVTRVRYRRRNRGQLAAESGVLREPPDVLLTTPESLEAMLISLKVEHGRLFNGLRAVVVDEVHAFAGDD